MGRGGVYLGLDIASRTGFCLFADQGAGASPRIRCGSWDCRSYEPDGQSDALSDNLTGLIRDLRRSGGRISRAAIEAPIRKIPTEKVRDARGQIIEAMRGNPNTMFVLNAMYGAARAILRQFRVPVDVVASASWRKVALGTGRKPVGADDNWFKREMKLRALVLGERLGFDVPDHDASDAVGIAIWLAAQSGHLPVGVLTGRGPSLFVREAAE